MIAPLKQLERLFGESVLPLISYAPFNESCSRFRGSAGSRHGENRTVEYTTGTKPGEYRIAREVSAGRQFDVWENARLFALVNLAMADGYIAGFEDKYNYNYWRPVTAIRERGDSELAELPSDPTCTGIPLEPYGGRGCRDYGDGAVLQHRLRQFLDEHWKLRKIMDVGEDSGHSGPEGGKCECGAGKRIEKRMVEACERRILEFPLGMEACAGGMPGRHRTEVLFFE